MMTHLLPFDVFILERGFFQEAFKDAGLLETCSRFSEGGCLCKLSIAMRLLVCSFSWFDVSVAYYLTVYYGLR